MVASVESNEQLEQEAWMFSLSYSSNICDVQLSPLGNLCCDVWSRLWPAYMRITRLLCINAGTDSISTLRKLSLFNAFFDDNGMSQLLDDDDDHDDDHDHDEHSKVQLVITAHVGIKITTCQLKFDSWRKVQKD
ncbi:hypothetical protein T01_10655 [Trichinella spiralis]|uniref:Uncharacterized protein n=1 Tax=Trichinella spiralis TaxID=6334 RepID=A0A0V1BJS1_TRISP|nr:hypothetical protein T01_10655 [Trichinella spiralis]